MGITLKNNAKTTLSSAITSTDTTIPVTDTSSFPALGVGDYFYCTIESTTGTQEIVKVTQVNNTNFLATRAQEDTIAIPFATGARVELRITVQSLEDQFGVAVPAAVDDYLDDQIGVTVQAYDADTAKLDVIQDWTARQTFNDGVHVNNTGSGNPTQVVLEKDGTHRWAMFRNTATESGADAGSNFDFYSYDDAGSLKDLIYRITRSTGVLNFGIQPTISGSNILKASDIGTSVQAYDADLANIAALSTQTYGRGLLTYADEAAFKAGVNLEANTDFYAPGGTDVPVADGGTGASTAKAAAANLQLVRVIAHSGVAVPLTGTASETVMATVPISAGELGPNGFAEWDVVWSCTNNANTKTVRVRLGSSGAGLSGTIFDSATPTSVAGQRRLGRISNRNSSSSQVSGSSGSVSGTGTINAPTTGTINTANATDLVLTAQLANTGDTVTLESYIVRLYYGA